MKHRSRLDREPSMACPLCQSSEVTHFSAAHGRTYRQCLSCGLVFLDPEHRLSPASERAFYETHENQPADSRYRAFLSRLADPLAERLTVGSEGLDYGSGPGPTLSAMLKERGFRMKDYDPFFAPNDDVLDLTYDFITCSETAEHFFDPRHEFERFDALLRPGGWLGLMTEVLDNNRFFETWRYARDPTHACFYRQRTFEWIAERFGWDLERPHPNVALFRKPGDEWN